jgi:hypothetical protein
MKRAEWLLKKVGDVAAVCAAIVAGVYVILRFVVQGDPGQTTLLERWIGPFEAPDVLLWAMAGFLALALLTALGRFAIRRRVEAADGREDVDG